MTEGDACLLACQAALLSDSYAISFLSESLDRCLEEGGESGPLLTALAWYDPEKALEYYDARLAKRGKVDTARARLEAYGESQRLLGGSSEQLEAYAALTALLPENDPQVQERRRALALMCARRSLEEFLNLPDWNTYADIHLFARLWLACPEVLWQQIHLEGSDRGYWRLSYYPIGQVLLSTRQTPGDIQRLVTLIEEHCQQGFGISVALTYPALLHSLSVIETHASAELRRLIPGLMLAAGKTWGPGNSRLIAFLLTRLLRMQMNTTELLVPLKDSVQQMRELFFVKRSLREIRRAVLELTSEPKTALRLMRVFRLFALLRRIDETRHTQRIRRWLRSRQRFIDSVEFPFWQELLHKEAERLCTRATLTRDEGLRLVCEAALLTNSLARDFLCQQLDRCLTVSTGETQLLLALAWLSPQDALRYYEALKTSQETLLTTIQQLHEAHQFHALSAEEKMAHQVTTRLLPENLPEVERRQHLYGLAQLIAQEAEEVQSRFVVGNSDTMNPFYLARMWLRNAELWGGNLGNLPPDIPLVAIGQWVLELRASPADLEQVAGLFQQRCQAQAEPLSDSELTNLVRLLQVLWPRMPEKLIPAVPEMLRIVNLHQDSNSAVLIAWALVLIARFELDTDTTLLSLLKRTTRVPASEFSQFWIWEVKAELESLSSVPPRAFELARLIQIEDAK